MKILEKIVTLENEADAFGFRWENASQIIDQIESECQEIREELKTCSNSHENLKLQEEIGDLFHAVFSLCVFCQFDPETTLGRTTDKFERRLHFVKQIAREEGYSSLEGFSFEDLMKIWSKAKVMANNK